MICDEAGRAWVMTSAAKKRAHAANKTEARMVLKNLKIEEVEYS